MKACMVRLIPLFALLIMLGCAGPAAPSPIPTATTTPSIEITPTPTIELASLKELERNIAIEAEGETLHYFEKKKWAEDEFSRVAEEEDKSRSNQIEKFKITYKVNAGNFNVEMDKKENSTILRCDIYVKFDTWYDFSWFLEPLGLDFINDHFERLEKELSWKGSLDGVKTAILLKFPFKINNCHKHVWPAR